MGVLCRHTTARGRGRPVIPRLCTMVSQESIFSSGVSGTLPAGGRINGQGRTTFCLGWHLGFTTRTVRILQRRWRAAILSTNRHYSYTMACVWRYAVVSRRCASPALLDRPSPHSRSWVQNLHFFKTFGPSKKKKHQPKLNIVLAWQFMLLPFFYSAANKLDWPNMWHFFFPLAFALFFIRLQINTHPILIRWRSHITFNLDGAPITSRTHTHPSHSKTSGLLTSSLSLGVPVPRVTQCIRGA